MCEVKSEFWGLQGAVGGIFRVVGKKRNLQVKSGLVFWIILTSFTSPMAHVLRAESVNMGRPPFFSPVAGGKHSYWVPSGISVMCSISIARRRAREARITKSVKTLRAEPEMKKTWRIDKSALDNLVPNELNRSTLKATHEHTHNGPAD